MSVIKLEKTPGSLASGYRSTLVSVDLLMRALNELQEKGALPASKDLDQAIGGIMVALKLGLLHFPSLVLKASREVPENPCPMCSASVSFTERELKKLSVAVSLRYEACLDQAHGYRDSGAAREAKTWNQLLEKIQDQPKKKKKKKGGTE